MEEKKKGDKVIIGGDFNARTERGREAKKERGDYRSEEKKSRNSKDGGMNREGRKLVEKIEEWGVEHMEW